MPALKKTAAFIAAGLLALGLSLGLASAAASTGGHVLASAPHAVEAYLYHG